MEITSSSQLDLILTSLGNYKRRGMINTLSLHPATVSQLAQAYDMSLPAAHKHIRSLEEARLIHRRKVGRTNFVALNTGSLKLMQEWAMQFNTAWGNDEQTLENYIASMQT
jgi:DNA-binding transcriptional ArsR family regulator